MYFFLRQWFRRSCWCFYQKIYLALTKLTNLLDNKSCWTHFHAQLHLGPLFYFTLLVLAAGKFRLDIKKNFLRPHYKYWKACFRAEREAVIFMRFLRRAAQLDGLSICPPALKNRSLCPTDSILSQHMLSSLSPQGLCSQRAVVLTSMLHIYLLDPVCKFLCLLLMQSGRLCELTL